jgi:hypothetical protein
VSGDSFGQSKSMDKRLAIMGKLLTDEDILRVIEMRFNERIEKEVTGYAQKAAKHALRGVVDEVRGLIAQSERPQFSEKELRDAMDMCYMSGGECDCQGDDAREKCAKDFINTYVEMRKKATGARVSEDPAT